MLVRVILRAEVSAEMADLEKGFFKQDIPQFPALIFGKALTSLSFADFASGNAILLLEKTGEL